VRDLSAIGREVSPGVRPEVQFGRDAERLAGMFPGLFDLDNWAADNSKRQQVGHEFHGWRLRLPY